MIDTLVQIRCTCPRLRQGCNLLIAHLSDTNKQVEQGWGAPTGESNWKDEQAGEAIAQKEEKETGAASEDNVVEDDAIDKEAEPEDKSKSYAEYLAELQENKQPDLGIKEARKPNEGSKPDKKWAQAKELKRLE